MAAGYGIGRSFTHDTLVQMSQHVAGVFGASFVAIGISLLVAWFTYKHTFANLLSCIMGMLPGGLNQMMLMADEDPRADANVVVMQQTIRLFGVVISVPFLVIHLLGASVVPQGLLAPVGDNMGLTWLVNLQKPPPILMNLAQLNIGLYMGCMLDKERLLRTRVLLPYAIIGTLLIIGGSIVVAEILVRYYGIPIVTAFLAMAPGGMTEMCLAGMSMGADVSIILTYQIVRLLMMNLTVPFILRRYFDDSYTG